MNNYEIKNAKIKSTDLGFLDHGFSLYLYLDYGGSGQGAGGRAMSQYDKETKKYKSSAYGMDLIMRILETVGVKKWEELAGKHIRVESSHSDVKAIGNLLNDKWLNFDNHAKEFYP